MSNSWLSSKLTPTAFAFSSTSDWSGVGLSPATDSVPLSFTSSQEASRSPPASSGEAAVLLWGGWARWSGGRVPPAPVFGAAVVHVFPGGVGVAARVFGRGGGVVAEAMRELVGVFG